MIFSRRVLFQTTAALAAAGMTPAGRALAVSPRRSPLKIGLASYSLRKFPLEKVIEVCKQADISQISLKSVHLPLTAKPDEIQAVLSKLDAAGISVVSG